MSLLGVARETETLIQLKNVYFHLGREVDVTGGVDEVDKERGIIDCDVVALWLSSGLCFLGCLTGALGSLRFEFGTLDLSYVSLPSVS